MEWSFKMDRQMIEGMLGDALEREIITAKMVDGAYPPAVAVGILDGPGREIGFGHGESQLTVILPDIGDCARFVDSCKALGGKVPLGTYGGELVSAMARALEREESAPALAALESALDGARRGGYCVFDRGIHDDVPDPGLVYLCSTYPAAVRLKDSLDSVRAQGNDPDCRTLGVYRVVDGYDYFIMGGLYGDTQADAYAVHGDLAGDWGAGEVAFRISDLKAKTFSYDIDADGGQKASTLVYYTDEGADPVLFQQADGDWRLASDNFLAENAIVEDLERAYTGEISPVYLNRDIVDMEEMAEAYGWVRPERTPASIAAVARKAAASSAAEKPSPGRPPRPRQPRSRRPARSPTLPARSRRTPRPGTDTMGVRMRPQALWHTHANAQPRIRTYPYIRIRIYA